MASFEGGWGSFEGGGWGVEAISYLPKNLKPQRGVTQHKMG